MQAEYWHDPIKEDMYRNHSIFLADINQERVSTHPRLPSVAVHSFCFWGSTNRSAVTVYPTYPGQNLGSRSPVFWEAVLLNFVSF